MGDDWYRTPHAGQYFYHRGQRLRLRRAGVRTLKLLNEVANDPSRQSTKGLLMLRPRIREVLRHPCPILLSFVLDRFSNVRVLRLATWMLGRMGYDYATGSVYRLTQFPAFRVRREAVRTLQRLHAWAELRQIACHHEDPRTRALAIPKQARPYDDRLATFVAASTRIPLETQDRELTVRPELLTGVGLAPKSSGKIARMLRRIHRLVRRSNLQRRRFFRLQGASPRSVS